MKTQGKEASGSRKQAAPGQTVQQGHPGWISFMDEGQLMVYFQLDLACIVSDKTATLYKQWRVACFLVAN